MVIDRDGIALGFGRNRRWPGTTSSGSACAGWRCGRSSQIGLTPQAFIAADLRLSLWNLDDGLRPVRGMPTAVLVRDNGLDAPASAMLDAVRTFRPNLVKS